MSFGAAVAVLAVAMPMPVMAIDGKAAVGICIDISASGRRCEWSLGDKGEIDICYRNGCVFCPAATGQCTAAGKTRPRPARRLPIGTKVITPVGTFEVAEPPRSWRILAPQLHRYPAASHETIR
jgi:hypothetical protein